jgi:hypothetical protein
LYERVKTQTERSAAFTTYNENRAPRYKCVILALYYVSSILAKDSNSF